MLSCYGEIPKYDNWYYNSEEQIAKIINFLNNDDSNSLVINEGNFEITHRAIQQAMKLYSNLINKEIHFIWHTFYQFEDFNVFRSKIKNSLLEILIRKDSLEHEDQLIKILSNKLKFENLQENIQNDILPILRKLFGETIIFYIDIKDNSTFFPKEHSFLIDAIIKSNTTVNFKIISNIPFLNLHNYNKIIFNDVDYIPENKYHDKITLTNQKIENFVAMNQEISTLKSLLILQHPANKISFDFIKNFIPEAEDAIKELSYSNLIYYLHDGGISFDKHIIGQTNQFKVKTVDKIASNTMKILSFDYPENFFDLTVDDKNIVEHISPHMSLLSLSSSIASNTVNGNYKMTEWLTDALKEKMNEKNIISIDNQKQVEVLINYLSQILLLNKDFDKLLPLLQNISYSLAEYIIHSNNSPENNLIASRWIYKVGYVYDRLKNPNRHLKSTNTRQEIYSKSSKVIKDYLNVPKDMFAKNAYRYAIAEYHAGNTKKSIEVFFLSSYRLYQEYLSEDVSGKGIYTNARFYSYELAIMGLCRDTDSDYSIIQDVLHSFIETNGITSDVHTFVNNLRNNQPINYIYPYTSNTDNIEISIFYTSLDTSSAYIIAEYLYKEFQIHSKLILYSHKNNFEEELKKSKFLSILLGAPDTPGGLGECISKLDPTLEHIYQFKMGENFHYPTLIKDHDQYYLILCGSGIGAILDGWFSYVPELVTEKILLHTKGQMMLEIALEKFGLSFIGKVGSVLGEKIITKLINKLGIHDDKEKENINKILYTLNTTSKFTHQDSISARSRNLLLEYTRIDTSLKLLLDVIETYKTQPYIEAKELKELSEDLIKIINIIKSQTELKKENRDILNHFVDSISEIYQQASNLYNQEIANININTKDLIKISTNCIETSSKLIKFILSII